VGGLGLEQVIAAELFDVEVAGNRERGSVAGDDDAGQPLDLEQAGLVVTMTAANQIPRASVIEQRVRINVTLLGQPA
jgi:hypothetical protein